MIEQGEYIYSLQQKIKTKQRGIEPMNRSAARDIVNVHEESRLSMNPKPWLMLNYCMYDCGKDIS